MKLFPSLPCLVDSENDLKATSVPEGEKASGQELEEDGGPPSSLGSSDPQAELAQPSPQAWKSQKVSAGPGRPGSAAGATSRLVPQLLVTVPHGASPELPPAAPLIAPQAGWQSSGLHLPFPPTGPGRAAGLRPGVPAPAVLFALMVPPRSGQGGSAAGWALGKYLGDNCRGLLVRDRFGEAGGHV